MLQTLPEPAQLVSANPPSVQLGLRTFGLPSLSFDSCTGTISFAIDSSVEGNQMLLGDQHQGFRIPAPTSIAAMDFTAALRK